MRKKFFVGALALGFALMGNAVAHANPAFNGTWVCGRWEDGRFTGRRLILNNGNWTMQGNMDGAWHDAARGTFTTLNNTIAFHVTNLHRNEWDLTTGPEWLDRNAARAAEINAGASASSANSGVSRWFAVYTGSLYGTSVIRAFDYTFSRQ